MIRSWTTGSLLEPRYQTYMDVCRCDGLRQNPDRVVVGASGSSSSISAIGRSSRPLTSTEFEVCDWRRWPHGTQLFGELTNYVGGRLAEGNSPGIRKLTNLIL